jgi:hypothetical protein
VAEMRGTLSDKRSKLAIVAAMGSIEAVIFTQHVRNIGCALIPTPPPPWSGGKQLQSALQAPAGLAGLAVRCSMELIERFCLRQAGPDQPSRSSVPPWTTSVQ